MKSPHLTLIRGDGADGTVFEVDKAEFTVGRTGSDLIFPDDPGISANHCSLHFSDGELVVRDEKSRNGVFLRIHSPTSLGDNQLFLCGEQVFRFERYRAVPVTIGVDGAVFGGTPISPWRFRVVQLLAGGYTGLAFCARKRSMTVGREDCDINFYQDPYISHYHSRLEERGGQYILTDLDSRNGTFVRIEEQVSLNDGDHIFLGRQLLRIDDGA
ncbi:MAG: pSer/pThr/pTyr-binding forkhead associated (FHA) protein [Myxococcota bacterium]|jgi:pSer/pThr/pTyr-binding forkhead associated (FHA) protein